MTPTPAISTSARQRPISTSTFLLLKVRCCTNTCCSALFGNPGSMDGTTPDVPSGAALGRSGITEGDDRGGGGEACNDGAGTGVCSTGETRETVIGGGPSTVASF